MRFVSDRAIAITAAMVGLGMALSACSLPPGAPMPGVSYETGVKLPPSQFPGPNNNPPPLPAKPATM